jgi:hypothetical protein
LSSKEANAMSTSIEKGTLEVHSTQSDAYPRAQAVFAICALVILLLWLNVYPQHVGFWISATSAGSYVPVLSPAFFSEYLPWLNLCWMLALGLNIAHLSLGRWTLVTRLLDLGLAFLALNVVVAMIFGPPIFAVDPQLDSATIPTAQTVTSTLAMIAPFVLGVIALGLVIDMIKKVVDLVRSISP